jgi:hypothetical protein
MGICFGSTDTWGEGYRSGALFGPIRILNKEM